MRSLLAIVNVLGLLLALFASYYLLPIATALIYGETGTTFLPSISDALATGSGSAGLVLLGFLLVLCGFGFKLGLVPFHAWAPDVYQGAPSPFVQRCADSLREAGYEVSVEPVPYEFQRGGNQMMRFRRVLSSRALV